MLRVMAVGLNLFVKLFLKKNIMNAISSENKLHKAMFLQCKASQTTQTTHLSKLIMPSQQVQPANFGKENV